MDAISFVVGLSARSLRGDKLRDLIYRSTARTAASQAREIVSRLELDGPSATPVVTCHLT